MMTNLTREMSKGKLPWSFFVGTWRGIGNQAELVSCNSGGAGASEPASQVQQSAVEADSEITEDEPSAVENGESIKE